MYLVHNGKELKKMSKKLDKKTNKLKDNNAYVEVKKENGYEHIFINCEGFGTLQVRPIKYNSKCIYKLKKCLKGE